MGKKGKEKTKETVFSFKDLSKISRFSNVEASIDFMEWSHNNTFIRLII
jgi:hypothetical protein